MSFSSPDSPRGFRRENKINNNNSKIYRMVLVGWLVLFGWFSRGRHRGWKVSDDLQKLCDLHRAPSAPEDGGKTSRGCA